MSDLEMMSAIAGKIDPVLCEHGLQIAGTEEGGPKDLLVTFVIGKRRKTKRTKGGAR
jgi:hypothetical protein